MKNSSGKTKGQLQKKVEELQTQLTEANATLRAIHEGEVDAVIVSGAEGEQVFSLAGAESVYRLIVETMQEAAFTVSFDGTILYCNARFGEFLGRPITKVLGHPLQEFIALDNRADAETLLSISQQQPVKQRLVFQNAEGVVVPAHVSSTILDQPGSRSICLVATDLSELENSAGIYIRDITERQKAQAQLLFLNETLEQRVAERTAEVGRLADQLRALATELTQTEQRERQRLAGVLHDHIQQLLVSALIQLSLIKRGDSHLVQSAAQATDLTIREALAASRSLTVELFPPVLQQAGLAAALSWLAMRMEETNRFKVHICATSGVELSSPEVRAFLFGAVREVLLNSLKHSGLREAYLSMPPISGNHCTIIIEDKGKGFCPTSVKPGLTGGFGLFSLQQRLLHLGGTLEIESAPGKGTKVVLSIPIDKDSPPELPFSVTESDRRNSNALIPEKNRCLRVLLVDDHKIMRQGLANLLQLEPDIEIVGEAENGAQAIDKAVQYKPDVIVMDVSMPLMDGIKTTRILSREMPQIKVIGLSMHLENELATAMRKAGAVAYLTKGGPSEDLVAAIRACRGRKS